MRSIWDRIIKPIVQPIIDTIVKPIVDNIVKPIIDSILNPEPDNRGEKDGRSGGGGGSEQTGNGNQAGNGQAESDRDEFEGDDPDEMLEGSDSSNQEGPTLREIAREYGLDIDQWMQGEPMTAALTILTATNPVAFTMFQLLRHEPGLWKGVRGCTDSDEEAVVALCGIAEAGSEEVAECVQAISIANQYVYAGDDFGLLLQDRLNQQTDGLLVNPATGEPYTDDQAMTILFGLPYSYRPFELNWQTSSPEEWEKIIKPLSDDVRSQIASAHQEWLHDLFVGSAEQTNIQQFSGLSNEAAAAFMLAQVRLEGENWLSDLDVIRSTPPNDLFGLGAQFKASIASQFRPIQDFFWFGEYSIGPLFTGNRGSKRTSGTSFGIPNIYQGQADEAWIFHEQTDSINVDSLRTNRGIFSYFPRDINEDPFFAMRMLGLVQNWAGVRQRIGVGAGSEDEPAIRTSGDNVNFPNNATLSEPVSAFSLAVTRYSDAVDAVGLEQIVGSQEFQKMLQAVEGVHGAAEALGFTIGDGDEYDIDLFDDFVPYTDEQAQTLVNHFKSNLYWPEDKIERDWPELWNTYRRCVDTGNCA